MTRRKRIALLSVLLVPVLVVLWMLLTTGCSFSDPDMRISVIIKTTDDWHGRRTYVKCIETGEPRGFTGPWGAVGDTILVDFTKGWGP